MNQNEINRVAGAGSIWGDLSLRLVIARLAGTTHFHFSLHPRDTGLHGPRGKTKAWSLSEFFFLRSWQVFQTPCLSRLSISPGFSNTNVY